MSAAGAPPDAERPVPRCGVVLVAAGRGERLGGGVAKQFAPLGGEPLFLHSLRVFQALPFISEIALVLPAEGVPREIENLLKTECINVHQVRGGARRQDSVGAGLAALAALAAHGSDFDVALVHDAARPFPDPVAIAQLARAAGECGGAILAQPAVDTIKQGDAQGYVAATLDRAQLWLAQTPQALRRDLVVRAVGELRDPELTITDEAMLLERWGVPVRLVAGGAENFKVTLPGDFARAEALLHRRRETGRA